MTPAVRIAAWIQNRFASATGPGSTLSLRTESSLPCIGRIPNPSLGQSPALLKDAQLLQFRAVNHGSKA